MLSLPGSALVLGAILLIVVIYIISIYNALVRLRNHISDAWSNVDTELLRRYELIPNLVAAVKGYAAHERETLERVIELRNTCIVVTGCFDSFTEFFSIQIPNQKICCGFNRTRKIFRSIKVSQSVLSTFVFDHLAISNHISDMVSDVFI